MSKTSRRAAVSPVPPAPKAKPEQRPVLGVAYMVMAGLLFVGVTAGVRYIGTGLPAAQGAFIRYAFGIILTIPALYVLARQQLTRRQWGMSGLRGVVHSAGVILWFYSMARIPLADVTALGYLTPILVTIGAALFMGERLAVRRIVAVVVGLIGACIILRPGLREIGPGHLSMLVAAMLFAVSYSVAKVMTDDIGPVPVVALMSLTVTIGLAPAAIPVWQAPTGEQWAVLAFVACVATAGHYLMTLAFREAPITVTQPVTFLQLVWAVLLGVLVFGEPIDPWVVFGGVVIISAVSFITWRESRLKRRVTPPAPATKL